MLLLNTQPINHFLFSGGEFQVKIPHKLDSERAILTWKPVDASEITLLVLAINALKHSGINDIDLDILYLPYARQDRVCHQGEAHSLEVMINILEAFPVSVLRFWDLHNLDATIDLLGDVTAVHTSAGDIFDRYKILDDFDLDNLILCAPDDGAYGRVQDIVDKFDFRRPIAMHKVRCPETGRILEMKSDKYNRDIEGWNILIVDDICDGGATFIETAEILKAQGAANLYLYVTHGIFSKGLGQLLEHFKHIYCHHVLHDDTFQSTDKLSILQEHSSAR